MEYEIKSKLWLYPGAAGWHFITIPENISKEIKTNHTLFKRGFGSIPVTATINKSLWKTSIFPHQKTNYVIPVKKLIRQNENLKAGDSVNLKLKIKI